MIIFNYLQILFDNYNNQKEKKMTIDIKDLKEINNKSIFNELINIPSLDQHIDVNKIKFLTFNYLMENISDFTISEVNDILSSDLYSNMKVGDKFVKVLNYFINNSELINNPNKKWFENISKKNYLSYKNYLQLVINKDKSEDISLFSKNFLRENISLVESGSLNIKHKLIDSYHDLILEMKNIMIDPLLKLLEEGKIKEMDIIKRVKTFDRKNLQKLELYIANNIIQDKYTEKEKETFVLTFPLSLLNTLYSLDKERAKECASIPYSHKKSYETTYGDIYSLSSSMNILQFKLLSENGNIDNSVAEKLFNNFRDIIFKEITIDNRGYEESHNYLSYSLKTDSYNNNIINFLSANYQKLNTQEQEISFVIALNSLFEYNMKSSILIEASYDLTSKYHDKFANTYNSHQELEYLKTLQLSKALEDNLEGKDKKATLMKI